MKKPTRLTGLLTVLAIALAACSAASANDTPDTTPPPMAETPVTETPVTEAPDEPMPAPGDDSSEPDITYRPIEVEDGLVGDAYVPGGGELVSVDDRAITVGFWMGVDTCYGIDRIDVAETETKVTVDITVKARALDQVCIAIAEARSVTVELAAPLGGRILEIGGAPVNG
ncbi:MAG TPA: hypothetical protein VMS74_03990 [Acidimicrobiia bacterium]|nr:hypothetical protein [Acidimicrobiia bacterium]